jgi:hypothetical protein
MLTPASSTRGAPTTSQGAGVRPAFSNSSASGGWFLEDSNIVFESDRETMFTTNSPVSSILLRVSLAGERADCTFLSVRVGAYTRVVDLLAHHRRDILLFPLLFLRTPSKIVCTEDTLSSTKGKT